jgi:NAD kinase
VTTDHHLPRIVLVTRRTPLELLLAQHGTLAQARFYLKTRGERVAPYEEVHARFEAGMARVVRAIPADQRRVRVDRAELDRFLFAPDDLVVVVGQDGLVPNTAKYLDGQRTIGINPDPERYDGVLCRHTPADTAALLRWTRGEGGAGYRVERRVMAVAEREDGQRLLALNEIFVGHRSHQSARYRLRVNGREERQSSSGVICATGTGSTGWARSIVEQRRLTTPLPAPADPRLAWFVREPFPSVYTGTDLNFGFLKREERMVIHSEMGHGGVIFADGIEADYLTFLQGHSVHLTVARTTLNLVVPTPEEDR